MVYSSPVVDLEAAGDELPSYLALRSHEVNMRAGPGTHYPIEWVYHKKGLPMKVLAKFNHWRKVKDWQGSVGWIHRSLLTSRKYVLIQNQEYIIYKKPDLEARPIAKVSPGIVAYLESCEDKSWCFIHVKDYKGWIKRTSDIWGP